jgi:hypothetical protein
MFSCDSFAIDCASRRKRWITVFVIERLGGRTFTATRRFSPSCSASNTMPIEPATDFAQHAELAELLAEERPRQRLAVLGTAARWVRVASVR